MKHIRYFCVAAILIFTLTFSAFAGDIHCGIVSDSPLTQSAIAGDTAYIDPVTELTLNVLQSLLSLF